MEAEERKDGAAKVGRKPRKPDEEFQLHDNREHLNVVFIGHVDAGKSTCSGQILVQTGMVDERTIAKYEREAKEKNRESWYLAYIMDTNEEERAKGKTVEVGRAHFETQLKRYTLLDAPGHKSFVPNMIGGASQADVAILIISARKDEFETGFERGGQTREHALLARTLGLNTLIVAVNKMDDPTVDWSEQRYTQIVNALSEYLKKVNYRSKDLIFLPISAFTGLNIKKQLPDHVAPWYKERKTLLQVLDELPRMTRDPNGPLRVPVVTRYKDLGVTFMLGKVESGTIRKGDQVVVAPNGRKGEVLGILVDDNEVNMAGPGENVDVKLKNLEEDDLQSGYVLCDEARPAGRVTSIEVQMAILELLPHKAIMSAGYRGVIHCHTAVTECTVDSLVSELDRSTGKLTRKKPPFVKNGAVVVARITLDQTCTMETFKDVPQLGRLTLRDEGKTVAVGKILAVNPK
jgi:peptide chain release factor subunit 3